jgi:hypothetical protein
MVLALADYFHVSVDYLIGLSDAPTVSRPRAELTEARSRQPDIPENLSRQENDLLTKFRYIEQESRDRIMVALNYEYTLAHQKKSQSKGNLANT